MIFKFGFINGAPALRVQEDRFDSIATNGSPLCGSILHFPFSINFVTCDAVSIRVSRGMFLLTGRRYAVHFPILNEFYPPRCGFTTPSGVIY